MRYGTFSDLMHEVEKLDGDIQGDNAVKLAEFYSYWINYLEPAPAFLSYLSHLPGGIAKVFYQITVSLEHVFNNMFKLFGLFGYLGDNSTLIGQFFYWFQVLGTSIFTLVLIISALLGVFTKPVKYKNVITNFLLVTFMTTALPLGLTIITQAMAEDARAIQTLSSGKEDYSSLAIQPIKNNVVDLKILVDNDFSTKLFPLDNYGYIKPVQEGSTPVNNITDDPEKRDTLDFVTKIDFAATYGATNGVVLDDMEIEFDEKYGVKGIKGLFLHRLDANQTGVETITEHRFVNGLNAFEPVYMRYKVNWIGMFIQYGILMILLGTMAFKFVKSVFDIIIQAMISPIVGYSSVSKSTKYKELLRTIGGALAGIMFEVIIIRVVLEICRDLPTLSVSAVTKLSGGFFDGLNMWEQVLSASLVYLGLFYATMQGIAMVERWLGVSTAQSDSAQQLMSSVMAGNALFNGARGFGHGALAAADMGANLAGAVPGFVAGGSRVIGNSLSATGGGLRGFGDAVKDQGFVNTATGGLSNMVNLADAMGQDAVGKVKDFAGGVADNLSQKEQAGHDATYAAFKNPAAEPKVGFNSKMSANADYGLNRSGHYGGEPLFSDSASGTGSSLGTNTSSSGGGITDPTLAATDLSAPDFTGISDPSPVGAGNYSNVSAPNLYPETSQDPLLSGQKVDQERLSSNQKSNIPNVTSQVDPFGAPSEPLQSQNPLRGLEFDEDEG
ncbi:hypothetical protein E5983_01775 [Streptococcus danieliae]|uniref:DUF8208 domain-containing protein n=1 Tax=Streptococcus danieliae TaxID=747656 RepID=A0A7X3G776_9STRE|nr:hypothetical protein [Streptococcus danieliae]MVX58381.1 hypothetical protein [Streptococcus danieliae]